MELVERANRICIGKPKNQAIRASSARVISWVEQENEFSRGAMEKALCLTLAQSEWHIKELVKKGIIKRTNKFVYKVGKGRRQVVYMLIK